MLRSIAGFILGYLVMGIVTFASLTAAYVAMGTQNAFEPASYTISKGWIAVMLAVGAVASLAGGWVCRRISASASTPKVLAGAVLIMGCFMAAVSMGAAAPVEPRPADMSNMDAMMKAQTPAWVHAAMGLIECIGIVLGAGIGRPKSGGNQG